VLAWADGVMLVVSTKSGGSGTVLNSNHHILSFVLGSQKPNLFLRHLRESAAWHTPRSSSNETERATGLWIFDHDSTCDLSQPVF
jgi:hypothetical protein